MAAFTPHNADNVAIATVRTLAADVVGKANSGHPGAYTSRSQRSRRITQRQVHRWVWPLRRMSCSPGAYRMTPTSLRPPKSLTGSSTPTRRAQSGITATALFSPTGKRIQSLRSPPAHLCSPCPVMRKSRSYRSVRIIQSASRADAPSSTSTSTSSASNSRLTTSRTSVSSTRSLLVTLRRATPMASKSPLVPSARASRTLSVSALRRRTWLLCTTSPAST